MSARWAFARRARVGRALALGVLALLALAGCRMAGVPDTDDEMGMPHHALRPPFSFPFSAMGMGPTRPVEQAAPSEQAEGPAARRNPAPVAPAEQAEGPAFGRHSAPVRATEQGGPLGPGTGAGAGAAFGPSSAVLRVEGRHFVASDGRVVLLRGVNLLMGKCPPIRLDVGQEELDRVAALGFNAVRLPFIWEAYEPERGRYDETYLARMVEIAAMAWSSGLYTIVDVHQDGFARTLTHGCGDGFPLWAVSPRARTYPPNNGCDCADWPLLQLIDPGLHRSFSEFYADTHGVRTRYLIMLDRVAAAFSRVPGVIGYDPLNEPWGDERREIAPLYRDAARTARARHPSAILFLEPRGPASAGLPTWLPNPGLANVAFAPHYYYPMAIVRKNWSGRTAPIKAALARVEGHAAAWNAPLVLGEMGLPASAHNAGKYVDFVYDRLDAALASSLQWNVAPGWGPEKFDGWNTEDFSLIDDRGRTRPSFRPRPFPQRVAGLPVRFQYEERPPERGGPRLDFAWTHRVGIGPTEIRVPPGLFPRGAAITVEPAGTACAWDEARRLLVVDSPAEGPARVVLEQR